MNLGCKVNRVEADTIAASLLAAGFERAPMTEADVVVVNTCTVTAEADAKTRKAVRRAASVGRCPVVVTGCAAAIDAEGLSGLAPEVVVRPVHAEALEAALEVLRDVGGGLVPPRPVRTSRTAAAMGGLPQASGSSRRDLPPDAGGGLVPPRVFLNVLRSNKSNGCGNGGARESTVPQASGSSRRDLPATPPGIVSIRAGEGFKTRMDIKIQDGCDNRCTYCIVSTARGPARSVPADEVVSQIRSAAGNGVGEVVLTGINLGCYCDGGIGIAELTRLALERTGIGRIRISSIEPGHVTPELASVLGDFPGRLCAHFHIPLQAGCDATLRRMGRPYGKAAFAEKVDLIKSVHPDAAITTDVIVGFPQESDEDFEESLDFCRSMGFSKMHVFRYSKRQGTPAASMEGQVGPETSAERSRRMRELSNELGAADMARRVGSVERVLMMTDSLGITESYHGVSASAPQPKGALLEMRLASIGADGRFEGETA